MHPEVFSSKAKTVSWISLGLLEGDSYIPIPLKGIKVSRIEFVQNGNVIGRTHDVNSYSISGRYQGKNIEFINSFKNEGKNKIDIVFYLGSKEVARLEDYEIISTNKPIVTTLFNNEIGYYSPKFARKMEIINVNPDSEVDLYLVDESGERITNLDGILSDEYNSEEYKREIDFKLSLKDQENLDTNGKFKYVATVDGEEVEISVYNNIWIGKDPHIQFWYDANMSDLKYRVEGINLMDNGPYTLKIRQDEILTKEIKNLQAKFDEEKYAEFIEVDLEPEYFNDYGKMYNVEIFDSEGNSMGNLDYLEPMDDTSAIEDIVNPFEGFNLFDKKENIEPDKIWRIDFSQAVDEKSISKENAYVINKRSGLSVDVDYSFESGGKTLVMTPLDENFISGESYFLIVDKRVKSKSGENLNIPAALEFQVR